MPVQLHVIADNNHPIKPLDTMADWNLLALKLSARLPLPVSHALGSMSGWLASWLPIEQVHVADINLARCFPELDARTRRRLRRRSMAHLGKMVAESGRIWLRPADETLDLVCEMHNREIIEQAWGEGRGLILASPHIGCWEIAGLWCSRHFPLHSMYKPQPGPIDEIIRKSRSRGGATLVPTNPGGVRALLRALRRKEAVGILPDRAAKTGSVFAPFFGHERLTPTLASKLALRTDAPIIFVVGERLPWGRGYRLHFVPGDPEIASPDEKTAARALNQSLEKCIRMLPEQYWWTHKMFRRPPPGLKKPYKKKKT
jgi:Kdo2-lipid IVA lauroyltransferase/acyltransferase